MENNYNFDELIAQLNAQFTSLNAGEITVEAFSTNVQPVVGDMIIAYVMDANALTAEHELALEGLLLEFVNSDYYNYGRGESLDVELDKLVDSLRLDVPKDNGIEAQSDLTPSDPTMVGDITTTEDGFSVTVFQDINNDGVISLDEAAVPQNVSTGANTSTNIIGVVDINKDGVIDEADLGEDSIQIRNINPQAIAGDDGHVKLGTLDLAAFNAYNNDVSLELTNDVNGDGHIDAEDTISVTRIVNDDVNEDVLSEAEVTLLLDDLLTTYDDYIEGNTSESALISTLEDVSNQLLELPDFSGMNLNYLETIVNKMVADGFTLDQDTALTNMLNTLVTGVGAQTSNNGVDFYRATEAIETAYDSYELGLIDREELMEFLQTQQEEVLLIVKVDPDAIDPLDMQKLCDVLGTINDAALAAGDTELSDFASDLMDSLPEMAHDDTDNADDGDSDDDDSDDDGMDGSDDTDGNDQLDDLLDNLTDLISRLKGTTGDDGTGTGDGGMDGVDGDLVDALTDVISALQAATDSLADIVSKLAGADSGDDTDGSGDDDTDGSGDDDTDGSGDDDTDGSGDDNTDGITTGDGDDRDTIGADEDDIDAMLDALGDLSDQLSASQGSNLQTVMLTNNEDGSSPTACENEVNVEFEIDMMANDVIDLPDCYGEG
jgi:hypothetical protein